MKPYVLIAEDESAVSELLFYNLKKEDYEVAIASDGEDEGASYHFRHGRVRRAIQIQWWYHRT